MTSSEEKIIDAFKKKDWQEIQSADSWKIFKIMSEFVEGFEKLAHALALVFQSLDQHEQNLEQNITNWQKILPLN